MSFKVCSACTGFYCFIMEPVFEAKSVQKSSRQERPFDFSKWVAFHNFFVKVFSNLTPFCRAREVKAGFLECEQDQGEGGWRRWIVFCLVVVFREIAFNCLGWREMMGDIFKWNAVTLYQTSSPARCILDSVSRLGLPRICRSRDKPAHDWRRPLWSSDQSETHRGAAIFELSSLWTHWQRRVCLHAGIYSKLLLVCNYWSALHVRQNLSF